MESITYHNRKHILHDGVCRIPRYYRLDDLICHATKTGPEPLYDMLKDATQFMCNDPGIFPVMLSSTLLHSDPHVGGDCHIPQRVENQGGVQMVQ